MTAQILIVEDEMLVAMEMEAILADAGHHAVGIAPDLPTAQSYFETTLDLALVDLNLRDGLTGPQIGQLLGERGVPVVFVTANPRLLGDTVVGAIGVIAKPTDPQTLTQAVDYALARQAGRETEAPPRLRLFA